MLRTIRLFWRWLTPRQRTALVAVLVAMPLTAVLRGASRSTSEIPDWASRWYSDWPYGLFDILVNAAILFMLLSGLVRLWLHTSRSESESEKNPDADTSTEYRLLDDAAVSLEGSDALDRTAFVKKLSRTVVLPHGARSLVLALEAEWGAGKSSVINLLMRELKDHPDRPLIVQFNPWLVTGQNRIFRAFFSQFSASLLEKGERELASELVEFGETLEELLPSGGRALPRIGLQRIRRLTGRIPVIDLEGQKDHLSQSVQDFGRPIVVIIDDIDRLPPKDIRTMFQLVKAIAAFPRVTYLLAFDPAPVDEALRFGRTYRSGRDFRDKIVQANLPLPRVRYSARRAFFESLLNERLAAWKITLSQAEHERLARAIPLALAALRTPRDMKRALNKALLAAETVRGEVNFADVLVFETLHSKFPKVADLIRQNPRVVHPMGISDDDGTGDHIVAMVRAQTSNRKDKADRRREFLRMYPGHAAELDPLLTFLFPTYFESDFEQDSAAERLLDDRETLMKFVYQGLHGEFLSAQEAEAFLNNEDGRAARLADAVESDSLSAWLEHVTRHVAGKTIAAPSLLIRDVARAVNRAYTKSKNDSSSEARRFMMAVSIAVPESERLRALEMLLTDTETAAVGEEWLIGLLSDAGLWNDGNYLGPGRARVGARRRVEWQQIQSLVSLKDTWLATIRALGAKRLLQSYPNAISALFRWGQLAEPPYAEVRGVLERALDNQETAIEFMLRFPPGIGLSGIEKLLTRRSMERLQAALSAPELPSHIRDRFLEFFEELEQTPNPNGSEEEVFDRA